MINEFAAALDGRNAPHLQAGRTLKVVLFGSYARGEQVSDPGGGYFSDFDLLVVVNHDDLADGNTSAAPRTIYCATWKPARCRRRSTSSYTALPR